MLNRRRSKGVQVFVSYRREGGRDVARNIYERLSMSGYATFFDYDSMRNGKFNDQIYTAIDQATDFVLILSKNALDRCANEGDWVRTEIEYALSKKRNIILLATEDFDGFPPNLPPSIEPIRLINYIILSQNYYEQSITKLEEALTAKPARNLSRLAAIVVSVVAVGVAGWVILGMMPTPTPGHPLEGYSAVIHLMRYDQIRLLYNLDIPEATLRLFSYEDSMDVNGNTYIYPTSNLVAYQPGQEVKAISLAAIDSLFLPYHDPVIQLKLYSRNAKTLVLTEAVIEVDDFAEDNGPAFRFIFDGQTLNIWNKGGYYDNPIKLHYSFLHKGETFLSYGNAITLSLRNNIAHAVLNCDFEPDSLMGVLIGVYDESYPFTWGRGNMQYTCADSISQMSEIPIYHLSRQRRQDINLESFYRSLVKGEVDEEIHFRMHAPISSTFRIRLRMTTSTGDTLVSNYLNVRYIHAERVKGFRDELSKDVFTCDE